MSARRVLIAMAALGAPLCERAHAFAKTSFEPVRAAADSSAVRAQESAPPRTVAQSAESNVAAQESPVPQAVVDNLAQHALVWKTVEPGQSFEDSKALKAIVGDAHVVSLGDAATGARELFRAKQRVLEYLVSELGFTVLAAEINWPESAAVNEYVLRGTGDPKAALAGVHAWSWNTEEALELVQWMRRWNADEKHARKIELRGFDMQYTSAEYRGMHDYLTKVDEESAERMGLVLAAFRQADPQGRPRYWSLEPELKDAARSAVQDVLALFNDSKEIYVKRSSEKEWAAAYRCGQLLAQAEEMMRAGTGVEAIDVRERYLAENVLAILDEQPKGTRMVVWAENSHVRDTRDPSLRRMGSRLREKLGRDDAILGFVFDQGTFLAEVANADPKARKGPVEVRVGPAPAGTVESALARAENPLAAYDLARLPSDAPATKWLSDPRGMREAGSVFTTESALVKEVTPSRAFDALVFVAKVAPVHPLAKIEPKDK